MKAADNGWRHLMQSTRNSLRGLGAAWRHEAAFRQEVVLGLVLLPLAWWVGDDPVEWSLLLGSCLLVLVVELLNSAVECVVDRIGPERHELSGRAKDHGSAAVMVAMAITGLIWGLLLWEKFLG